MMSSLDLNRILTKLKRGCKLDPEKFIEKYLSHELPYDPVKAHEYYLRTRELKGRRSVSQLRGKSKKEGWLYTKNQIDEKHKLDVKNAALNQKKAMEALSLSAKKRREALTNRVKLLTMQTQNTAKAKQERIKREIEAKIAAIPQVPEGLSKQETAALNAKRNEQISALIGEGEGQIKAVGKDANENKKQISTSIKADRVKIVKDVKASVVSSREKYKQAREALKAKYQAELDSQYNTIKGSVQQRSKGLNK